MISFVNEIWMNNDPLCEWNGHVITASLSGNLHKEWEPIEQGYVIQNNNFY